MTDKITTIEDLAAMVQAGFEHTATKQDLESLATKEDLREVSRRLDSVTQRLTKVEHGLKSVSEIVLELPSKKTIEKLVQKVEDIDDRVISLEKKPASAGA